MVYRYIHIITHAHVPCQKRYQVMLTERKHIYVLHNHHLVMVFVKYGIVQDVCGGEQADNDNEYNEHKHCLHCLPAQ